MIKTRISYFYVLNLLNQSKHFANQGYDFMTYKKFYTLTPKKTEIIKSKLTNFNVQLSKVSDCSTNIGLEKKSAKSALKHD